tara:strand:- start:121 stop:468 length:348 start_codon:yes stop_codon:yes gene_type:complete
MPKLKDLVLETFQEILYEVECILQSDRSKNITKVTDNLRGVCGITVVTVFKPARPIGSQTEETTLRVKFFNLGGGPISEQLKRMATDAIKIDGISSFKPIRWKKVVSRIYRPTMN